MRPVSQQVICYVLRKRERLQSTFVHEPSDDCWLPGKKHTTTGMSFGLHQHMIGM